MLKAVAFILVNCVFVGHILAHDKLASFNGASISTKEGYRCQPFFDTLIEDLISQKWTEDEKPCLEQILRTINNIKNTTLWATWIWDSMQLPVGQLYGSQYQLGNYDQCLRETVAASSPPFRTQYCLADVTLQSDNRTEVLSEEIDPYGPTETYIHSKTKMKQHFNLITWGVCLPQICKSKSVETFLRSLLKQSHLGYVKSPVQISVESCEAAGESNKYIDGIYILVTVALFIVVFVIGCTIYTSKTREVTSESYVTSIIQCFCLKRNAKEFLRRPSNDVNVLHGIRFLSSSIIVLVHVISTTVIIKTGNGLDFEETFNSYGMNLLSLVIFVDTFFLMSGLLFMKNTKSTSSLWDLGQILIKRYFRLLWWYLTLVLVIIFIIPTFGCGPLCWRFFKPELAACNNFWWTGLLMISNYSKSINTCANHTWYIFCDFHMTVVGAVLFWIHQRYPRTGKICYTILLILSMVLPGWTIYNQSEISQNPYDFEMYDAYKHDDSFIFWKIYVQTHHRCTPYFVGILMGYFVTKDDAKVFRNITKKRLITALLVFLCVPIFLISYSSMSGNTRLTFALILAMHRLVWAVINCAVIGACEYGHFPSVADFLSAPIFVPLGKLTYGIYMCHVITVTYNLTSTRSPLHFNGYIMVEKFLGNLLLASLISLLFLLFVEAPLNNLVKLFLTKRRNTTEKIKNSVINGVDVNNRNGVTTSLEKDKQL